MKSFAQLVYHYARIDAGGAANKARLAQLSMVVAADVQYLLSSRDRWNYYYRHVVRELWGTESITLEEIKSNKEVRLYNSAQVDEKWVGQEVKIGGDGGEAGETYLIQRVNDDYSFIIHPDYTGSTVSSGTTATVYQRRIGLPNNFGKLLGDVYFDGQKVKPKTVEELNHAWSRGSVTYGTYICAIEKDWMQIHPSGAGKLEYSYSFMPETFFFYNAGKAKISSDNLHLVKPVDGANWKRIPEASTGMIFENPKDYQSTGYPDQYVVAAKESTTGNLILERPWTGDTGTFDYVISTNIDFPPYLDRPAFALARKYAGKGNDQEVANLIMDASQADRRQVTYSDDTYNDTWTSTVYHGGVAKFIAGI